MTKIIQKQTVKDVGLLSNGSYDTGKGQAFDDYLWDTNFIPSSRKLTQFFKTNNGSQYGAVAGDSKTEIETSMEDTGKLPAGQSFLINAITASLISNTTVGTDGTIGTSALAIVNAWRLIMCHSLWEIKFTNTEYSWRDSGSIFLPSVFEQPSLSVVSTATGVSNTQVGNFFHYNWIKVSTKVPVSELVSFAINVKIDSGVATIQTKLDNALTYLSGQKVEWRCQLKGMLLRKV
jgi:hypothetical protein